VRFFKCGGLHHHGDVACEEEEDKKKSETKEAVRRRRQRLRENKDFRAVFAEELGNVSGGGECRGCKGYICAVVQ
jgi:hypothetical protein